MIKNNYFVVNFSFLLDHFHVELVPVSKESLYKYAELYWREIVEFRGEIGHTWQDLSQFLIEPISGHLSENELIIFVPYSFLHVIPIHALIIKEEPLIKNHSISYIPSSSLLGFSRSRDTKKKSNLLSFGADFNDEAQMIAELFKTEAHLDVSKQTFFDNIGNASEIVHFSCHGQFNSLDPLSSGIVLYDGVLTAREIFNLKINVDLVTLSACQTGLSERTTGDELIGLTRSFFYAGASSIVVSLWSIDAISTQRMMLEFYSLLKEGKDNAIALKQAQIKIREKYPNPYYWAPFILIGN
ncbi:MAG: hypothetical protein HeimC3_34770 [Candidatus Heimdallarchaeota archaeon LC_3]|nr:MAG: hypothetical protein HeimC3_34770 [Candidatus Heimdallarchaeota archaeon LC_3]